MKKNLAMAFAASQLGFMVAGGLLLGLWLDRIFGVSPRFGIMGLIAGFGAGMRILMMLVRAQRTPQDRENSPGGDAE